MKIDEDTILVSMDVSSLYTNIPQKELVCQTYDKFHNNDRHYLREMLGLILKEISFHFNGEEYLQKKEKWTVMRTKTAVSFANILMVEIEKKNSTK